MIGSGLIIGLIHVLSGPDHLAALSTISVSKRCPAFWLGIKWGLGHSAGLLIVALLILALEASLDNFSSDDFFAIFDAYGVYVVGVFMLVLGGWGCKTGYDLLYNEPMSEKIQRSISSVNSSLSDSQRRNLESAALASEQKNGGMKIPLLQDVEAGDCCGDDHGPHKGKGGHAHAHAGHDHDHDHGSCSHGPPTAKGSSGTGIMCTTVLHSTTLTAASGPEISELIDSLRGISDIAIDEQKLSITVEHDSGAVTSVQIRDLLKRNKIDASIVSTSLPTRRPSGGSFPTGPSSSSASFSRAKCDSHDHIEQLDHNHNHHHTHDPNESYLIRRFCGGCPDSVKALMAGILHGIAGPGGVLGVAVGLAFPGAAGTATYLASFFFASTLTMGCFAVLYGTVTYHGGKVNDKLPAYLTIVSGIFSVLVGALWIILPALDLMDVVFPE